MSGRMYPLPADTSSRMRMYKHKAIWMNIDIAKFITQEIDDEIIKNLRSLQEADNTRNNEKEE